VSECEKLSKDNGMLEGELGLTPERLPNEEYFLASFSGLPSFIEWYSRVTTVTCKALVM
jgi:hypothetical protein